MVDVSEKSVIYPRIHLYKMREKTLSQNERRLKYLEEQKNRRHFLADKNRGLCDIFIKEIEVKFNEYEEEMECETSQTKNDHKFNFKLMMTEWFIEVPDDLDEKWLVKFAPEGFRILLVARNRNTSIYNKKGRFLFKIKTNFPGGGGSEENGTTVLDCIFNKSINTIFVLDCLFWNSMSMLDSEASFRFYWLNSKFQENDNLAQMLKYKFILIDTIPADRHLVQEKLFTTFKIEDKEIFYDGLVFYHKDSHYSFGYTPLATWLATFMLPEKLNIDIPDVYLKKKPINYINLQHYIENEAVFQKKRRKKVKENVVEMDV